MLDPRVRRLAEMLCSHSTSLGQDDCVLIHAIDIPDEAVAAMVEAAHAAGAQAFVKTESSRVQRSLMRGMTLRNAETTAEIDLHQMKRMTAYIAFRGAANAFEGADVAGETRAMWAKAYGTPVHGEQRVNHTKWAVLRWPSPGMAQQAGMSTEAFEDFYFEVCTVDYARMEAAARPLVELMNRTDRVEIKGPGTDLSFSIHSIGSVSCHGKRNIPDGECFSAPVEGSMNGTMQYNTVSLYEGHEFKDIRFAVRDGVIVEAEAGAMTARLNQILDTDPGARRFGEWSLGYNPSILHPMRDTLFDEKIAGSFHLTPGRSYAPPGGNGNESAIHWDIVCIQRPDYGGGEIWFDGVLIRKDGLFIVPELAGLNPDQLGA